MLQFTVKEKSNLIFLLVFFPGLLEHDTIVGKYSFVNRTVKSCNQLPAGLPASFPFKLNTFRKRIKNVVTSKGIQVGIEFK